MEERNNLNNNEWYRPAPAAGEGVTDLFEEAGLYKVKSREELYAQNAPKKRKRGWVIGLVCAVVLIGAIVLSAKVFGGEDSTVADAKDFFDAYSEFYEQFSEDEITGEYPMERAEPDPNREMKLELQVDAEPLTLQELYAKCIPSIVEVIVYDDGTELGWGTGVVMSADGYIITNAHVVDAADAATVRLFDRREFEAKLVGADEISDVALLKIDAKDLTPARFVDSATVQVGDEAIAIGNPLGEEFSGTMSRGIISGVSRSVNYRNRDMELLQTDAPINSGNSGGALFNIYGQVVGITNMKMTGTFTSGIEGVGFAIPTAIVKEMIDAILDEGAVVGRPGLGITVYDLSDLGDLNEVMEDDYDYPTDGMLVNTVAKGSDAEKQGLQVDDIITAIDGNPAESIEVIREAIEDKRVGDTVKVEIWRAGETMELTIALIDQNDF